MKTRHAVWVLAFCTFGALTAPSRRAEARACTMASDCPMGWSCDESDGGVAADGGPTGTCISLPCQSDSDCGPGLRCFIEGYSLGSGLPISASTPSLLGASTGGSACIPEWEIACTSASDCGPGFTCPDTTGGFGGSVNCGKDQDASEPPYATVTTIPCSEVPNPLTAFGDASLPPPFSNLSICEAGTTCTKVQWNDCVAPQAAPCSVDSDCPSTWTCGCETNCNGPVTGTDGGCVTVCLEPNADLFSGEVCFGGEGSSPGFNGLPTSSGSVPADSGASAGGSGDSPSKSAASGSQGGCQVGSGGASGSWPLVVAGILAMARWKPRRRRRST
jgi:hypothetical protein